MLPDAHILHFMGEQLMKLYCPRCHIAQLSPQDCRDHLKLAIANRWKIDFDILPGHETFSDALLGVQCGSAMREKLAVLYYSLTDPDSTGAMPQLLLHIVKKQRMTKTHFWDRFVREYESAHRHAAKSVALNDLLHVLETISKNDLKKVEEKVKKLMRGKK